MQLTLMQLDFSVSLNACHDEIMHKMQVLTNMQIELLRKFQHQLGNSDMHFEMIHDVRVMIVNLEEVYKDVKEYFNQMGIQFVYDFFRKIQVLMVCGYNFMSQALLVNVDKIQDRKNKELSKAAVPDCKVCKCTCDNSKNKKREIKQVEHFDYKISMLENQQQKLTSEIQNIYQKMMMQKTMIEKTKPSLAIRELEDMKQHIENVMESTNSIFEETYMMKYVEFKNYLTQIKKPEDIVDYFVSNMNYNMKDKFLKAMQKAIYKAQHMDEAIEMKHVKDSQTQTEKIKEQNDLRDSTYRGFSSLKPQKNSSLLTKERKYNQKMVAELQYVKKQLNSLVKEAQTLKSDLQLKQAERKKSAQNYETLQQLYNKRTLQLDEARSENRWLASEKQNQAKKLRHQIKELKKQLVQMVSQQTQTYIAPNCHSVSTQTEIIYFQNQVDNQIINVLKKANEKMINSLNEKEKKLRELKVTSEQAVNLRQCKLSCMAFLHDLREVTQYKMAELNKQSKTINPDKISTSKKPIIPLNEFTTVNSVNLTIQKLTEEIKKLLFAPPNKTRQNERHRTSMRRQSRLSSRISSNERRSSKISEVSGQKSSFDFFKHIKQRHTSMITGKSDLKNIVPQQYRKSSYNEEYTLMNDERRSHSQSSISQKNSQQASQKRNSSSHHRSVSSAPKLPEYQESDKKKVLKSQIRRGSVFCHKVLSQTITVQMRQQPAPVLNPALRSVQVQTDILRLQNPQRTSVVNKSNNQPEKNHKNQQEYQTFVLYGEFTQQTDLTNQILMKFQENYQDQMEQIERLKSTINELMKNGYQPHSNRKNQYMIRRPGKMQTQKFYTQENDRNYVSVNNSLPMNEAQISHNIQQHLNKTINEQLGGVNTSFANTLQSSQKSFNNMTLQSRLSALINPQSRTSINSGLVVFKKPKKEYQRRSAQVPSFDELKMEKSLTKEKPRIESRNVSFNTQRAEASFNLQLEHKTNWKEMISKIEEQCEGDKENLSTSSKYQNGSKPKNKPHLKSNFVQKTLQDDETLISKRSITRQATLIQVSKKTPIERERRSSPKSFELPETAFNRAVKHMLLTTESKQTIIKKLQAVCESLEKEKEQKRMKKTTKQVFTARGSSEQKRYPSKQNSQLFKLAEILG